MAPKKIKKKGSKKEKEEKKVEGDQPLEEVPEKKKEPKHGWMILKVSVEMINVAAAPLLPQSPADHDH